MPYLVEIEDGDRINTHVLAVRRKPLDAKMLESIRVGSKLKVRGEGTTHYYTLPVTSRMGKDEFHCRIDFVDDYGGLGGAEAGDSIVVRAAQVYGIDNTWRFNRLEIYTDDDSNPMLAYHKSGVLIGFRGTKDGKCAYKVENFEQCKASGALGNTKKAIVAKFRKLSKQALEYRKQLMEGRFLRVPPGNDEDDDEEGSDYY